MLQRLNSGRRILTFPAVHPCADVPPRTLLLSLLSLADNISLYKSKLTAANRRNAVETIRLIAVVRLFLESTHVSNDVIPDWVVLTFSELHLCFQKVQYLLEDCSRDDARVWMLMHAERVADVFRVLMRAMATALDVFDVELIAVEHEVTEQLKLAISQARRGRFEVDADDKLAVETVRRVLIGFEKNVEPERTEVKSVLDRIGITKWSRCEEEVRFLESEIAFENLREVEKRDVRLLSSLMGMMCYCRSVMFGVVNGSPGLKLEANSGRSEVVRCLNTEDFRCPITLEIMKDPVTIATGQSYDRSSILKWFRNGKAVCPKTGEKVKSMEVVPNLVVKKLIQQYCNEIGIAFGGDANRRSHDVGSTIAAGSLAAEGAMRMLSKFLSARLAAGSVEEKHKAAYEIRLLSKTSVFNRSCLVEAGVVPCLLKMLSCADSERQENAIAGLLNLSKHSKGKAEIVENWGVDLVVDVLKEGLKEEACQHAAGTLFYLASVEEYRIMIGENPRAIPALKELIKDGSDRGKKNALVAVFGLLTHPSNHRWVLAAGVVPLLFNTLTSTDSEVLVTDSLAILAALAEKPEGAAAIARCRALDSVVDILNSSTSRAAKEFCVSMLLSLSTNGGHNIVAILVKSPSLMGCLYSQLSEGTSRASKRASALIKILHEFQETKSSRPVVNQALPHERFVHVM